MQLRKLLITLGLTLLLGAAGLYWGWQWWGQARPDDGAVRLVIEPGESTASVASKLAHNGVLTHPRLWQLMARLQQLDGRIKQGEYQVPRTLSPRDLLLFLIAGKVVEYQLTFPEGITLAQVFITLQTSEGLQQILEGPADPRLQQLVEAGASLEGRLFPDTYRYTRADSDWAIVQRAHARMVEMLASTWRERDADLPYSNPDELLTMASIVERETGIPAERATIAGVFVRRLEKRMRLQTDPTVIYGLGASFDGNLRRIHLNDASNLYNTYRHRGLPPGPIALPGAAALLAAAHPAAGSALYFVARGDGSHAFSDTLQQHSQAVQKYQLRRKNGYHSQPPLDKPDR